MMARELRIGFFSIKNYFDRNSFSGTLYYMYRALKRRQIHLVDLGNPQEVNRPNISSRIIKKLGSLFSSKPVSVLGEAEYRKFSLQVKEQIKAAGCDLIFAPVAKEELSFFETELPIVFFSDTTAKLIRESYKIYSLEEEYLLACERESKAISKAKKLVYSSDWAATSAIRDYGADPDKIEIVPLGANMDMIPELNEILQKTAHLNDSRCRLLFVGKDWERKGGEIAYQTLLSLTDRGIDAELFMVGCLTPSKVKHPRLKVIPFLNKNIPAQQKKLSELLLSAHFLIFPTQADCSPIVICEANAYGIPVITTEVGGIPTILKNGLNGYMLPVTASGDLYADTIVNNFTDRAAYKNLVRTSREEYDTRLNWDRWAERMHQIFLQAVES